MTPNPQCATLETTIIDALHMMHDGKFLHLPVVDKGKLCLLNRFYNFLDFCAEYYLFRRWKCRCLCGCFADNSCCNFSGKFMFAIFIKFIAYVEGYIQESGYDVCLFLGDN